MHLSERVRSPSFPAVQTRRAAALLWWIAAFVALAVGFAGPAAAHPHVFVEAREEMVFDAQGRIAAIRNVWRFDDGFSAFATQGLDANGDGELSPAELAPLAKVNVDSLREYRYFTFMNVGSERIRFGEPTQYWLDGTDGRLTLFFTLPLKTPLDAAGKTVRLDVYDPEYFVAFTLTEKDPFSLAAAKAADGGPAGKVPQGCTFTVKRPADLDPMTATTLSLIPAEERDLPPNLKAVTEQLANTMTVTCPAKPAAVPVVAASDEGHPRTVGASPFGVGLMEAGGPPVGLLAVVAQWQRAFYGELTSALRAMKTDRTAILLLIAVSFAYGVFHAAGPGHGKAVISAYLVSSRGTARRAILLSLLSSLLQAGVAIAIVTIGAVVFRVTSFTMTSIAEWAEIASFGAVTLLGLYLVWRKIVRPLARALASWPGGAARDRGAAQPAGAAMAGAMAPMFKAGGTETMALFSATPAATASQPSFSALGGASGPGRMRLRMHGEALAPDQIHAPDCDCGGHAISPQAAAAGWRAAAGAVVSAGLRPCTGALIVLVFALSQGLYPAGIAATFAMALGTAATVAALALLAVGAKGVAMRLAARDGRVLRFLHRGVEAFGAIVVLAFGSVLFSAALLSHLG